MPADSSSQGHSGADDTPIDPAHALARPTDQPHDDDTPPSRADHEALPRMGEEAVAEAKRWTLDSISLGAIGYCLRGVREIFGVAAHYNTAIDAWNDAKYRHPAPQGDAVPRAVPVFWSGGSDGFGHVAISIGNGLCRSTDWKRAGMVDLARIDDITSAWALNLEGWTRDLNTVVVKEPIAHQPDSPGGQGDDPDGGRRVAQAIQILTVAHDSAQKHGRQDRADTIEKALTILQSLGPGDSG